MLREALLEELTTAKLERVILKRFFLAEAVVVIDILMPLLLKGAKLSQYRYRTTAKGIFTEKKEISRSFVI